ncbi:MAG: 2-dehydro-3-deoxyglucarate aldolase [Opitutaceae bacterium]|nr:2-dehydro-3-deoxyglucarate aldolase [Opitutaceae bacterium]
MKISADFRQRVLARDWVIGAFSNLGSSVTAEIAGLVGFDFLVLDHEHGPGGEETLLHQLQAIGNTPTVPIVRIAANETTRFKRTLDLGAHGVMVPWVSTAAEARAAVTALRYPPRGIRGVARSHRGSTFGADFDEYYLHAHEWLVTVAQIETPEGVANCEEIAAVEGVDVVFVGPTDLSCNLGLRDQYDDPRFIKALEKVSAAAKKHGKAAGILLQYPKLDVKKCRELGYTFIMHGADGGALRAGLLQYVAVLKQP